MMYVIIFLICKFIHWYLEVFMTKEAGMNEHLTKPVDGEKLLQVLYKYKKTGL